MAEMEGFSMRLSMGGKTMMQVMVCRADHCLEQPV